MPGHGDLDDLWSDVKPAIEARGFNVFPGPLNPGGGPFVEWPPSPSVDDFLEVATTLAAGVVYTWAFRYGPDDAALLSAELLDDPDEEVQALLSEASSRVGQIHMISVGFAVGGVAHLWEATADWYDDLEARRRRRVADAGVLREAEVSLREAEWVKKLADDLKFQSAKSNDSRHRVALALFPELDELSKDLTNPNTRWLAHRVVRQAWDLYEAEIKPEQERQIARDARRLMETEELSKVDAAARFGMGETRLRRILGMYPDDS